MLRQHMLHGKHAKTGFEKLGKLGERAASVQTRICVQRDSSFKYRGNVWLFLEDKGCIHGLENFIHNKHSIIQRLVAKNLDSEIVSNFDS